MGPTYALETLGGRLKWAREKRLGWSSRAMQSRLSSEGVDVESHTTVLRYEKNERVPPANIVALVARFAGLSPGWILTGEGAREPIEPGAKDSAFDVIAEIVDATRAGGGEDQQGDRDALYREAANKLREIAAETQAANEPAGSRKEN